MISTLRWSCHCSLEFRDCHGEWVARHSPALHDHVIPRVRSAAEGVILPAPPSGAPPGARPAGVAGAENGSVGSGLGGSAPEGAKGGGVAEIEETEAEKFLRAQALRVKEELRQALNKELEVGSMARIPLLFQTLDPFSHPESGFLSSSMARIPLLLQEWDLWLCPRSDLLPWRSTGAHGVDSWRCSHCALRRVVLPSSSPPLQSDAILVLCLRCVALPSSRPVAE